MNFNTIYFKAAKIRFENILTKRSQNYALSILVLTESFIMKKILVLPLLFIAIFSLAQKDSTIEPAYKRIPVLPAFKLLEADSVSYFSKNDLPKNKPVLIIL